MTGKALAFLLGVLTSIQPDCNALECFNCKSIGDVHDCNITSVCSSGESCSTVSAQPTAKGTARFNMGCIQNQLCGSTNTAGIAIGKRQTKHCDECCSSDHCNSVLCSHLQPSTCVDDETEDCAKLHSIFQICKDIQHAKLVCPKFCGLCDVVDGNWANWSNWSVCDVTCGNGTQVRTRTCTHPAPEHGGINCTGPHLQNQQCVREVCPVHGSWSTWSTWGACSSTCDIGIQRRDRSCSNPYPSRFGDHCFGDSRDDRICFQQPCANGGWTSWDNWSVCSVTCGGGIMSRSRSCTNPRPSILGHDCIGNQIQAEQCGNKIYQDHISAFSVNKPFNLSSLINGKNRLTFSDTIYQQGHDFDKSTGTFTCSIPGTYHFSVTLVKKRSSSRVDYVFCQLYKGTSAMIFIAVDPTDDDSDKGSASISQSIVLHLDKRDQVYLSGCTDPGHYMEYWSSFTGFLLYSEN